MRTKSLRRPKSDLIYILHDWHLTVVLSVKLVHTLRRDKMLLDVLFCILRIIIGQQLLDVWHCGMGLLIRTSSVSLIWHIFMACLLSLYTYTLSLHTIYLAFDVMQLFCILNITVYTTIFKRQSLIAVT